MSERDSALRVLGPQSEKEAVVQMEKTAKASAGLVPGGETAKPEMEQRAPTGPERRREEPQRRPRAHA